MGLPVMMPVMVDRTFDNTTDGLRAWLEERGPSYFGGNARLYATAVDRIASQRVANEPATVEWMLSHLDALGKRLAHREKLA